jgi:hypothetical protein
MGSDDDTQIHIHVVPVSAKNPASSTQTGLLLGMPCELVWLVSYTMITIVAGHGGASILIPLTVATELSGWPGVAAATFWYGAAIALLGRCTRRIGVSIFCRTAFLGSCCASFGLMLPYTDAVLFTAISAVPFAVFGGWGTWRLLKAALMTTRSDWAVSLASLLAFMSLTCIFLALLAQCLHAEGGW